jgi:site-specific recombinase XerD
MNHIRIQLPPIERPKKLPVILSQNEIKILLKTPVLLKHRLILALLYGCGLRCFELRNLKIKDISFERMLLHVRSGKGRKDRYVPMDDLLVGGIKKYLSAVNPGDWLFNGNDKSGKVTPLSQRGVQWVVKQAAKKSGIDKQITAHTLRHSYATHLPEMGLDIVSLKEVLGHADIQTTMIYLHVSNLGRQAAFSPLERLYKPRG